VRLWGFVHCSCLAAEMQKKIRFNPDELFASLVIEPSNPTAVSGNGSKVIGACAAAGEWEHVCWFDDAWIGLLHDNLTASWQGGCSARRLPPHGLA